jgi:hypothetical protein
MFHVLMNKGTMSTCSAAEDVSLLNECLLLEERRAKELDYQMAWIDSFCSLGKGGGYGNTIHLKRHFE